MTLSNGTRLGSFEISGLLGVGGMGEVYRAKDTKLGREVAIKVLPEVFAKDKDRLARFEREAKLLASLDHSNIASIHDLQETDGVRFLVMQLVEGRTLADRIAGGAIPIEEVLPVFAQFAEALESAHDQSEALSATAITSPGPPHQPGPFSSTKPLQPQHQTVIHIVFTANRQHRYL